MREVTVLIRELRQELWTLTRGGHADRHLPHV